MSTWGNFVWGDGTLYGASNNQSVAWIIEVDWDGDGLFDGSNEAFNLLSISSFRGRKAYLDTGTGFASIETGSAKITLKNDDGRYDAWNIAGPLYPNVRNGHDVRIRVADLSTGTAYPFFFGTITDIQASNYGDKPTAVLTVEDGWRKLRRASARVPMTETITASVAIGLVLDAVKWPARWGRNLDISSGNISYFWSSGNQVSAVELQRLADAFMEFFFISADGVARYISRSSSVSPVADLLQENLSKNLSFRQPWEYQRNITRIKTHPRTVAATGTLWQLSGSPPSIDSGVPLVIWANYTYQNTEVPARNVITPVPTTDYTANTASNGSGTDKTGQVSLTFTDFGDTAKLVFSYSGGGTIYLTSSKVRGDAVYELSVTDVTYPKDPSTVDEPREFLLDLPWQQSLSAAVDFAAIIGPYLADEHPFPWIAIDTRPDLQFALELFDVVSLWIDRVGIDGVSFRVGGIQHQASGDNCQQIITTFYLEPYINTGLFWIWPVTNFGVDTIFSW